MGNFQRRLLKLGTSPLQKRKNNELIFHVSHVKQKQQTSQLRFSLACMSIYGGGRQQATIRCSEESVLLFTVYFLHKKTGIKIFKASLYSSKKHVVADNQKFLTKYDGIHDCKVNLTGTQGMSCC